MTPTNESGNASPERRIIFLPGPVTTSSGVRAAMNADISPWDDNFVALMHEIREGLVEIAGGGSQLTSTVMPGSGSFGVEAMLGAALSRTTGKLLIMNNGAYGRRFKMSAEALGIPFVEVLFSETEPLDPARLDAALHSDAAITHVACVHCESTTGLLNPLRQIGAVVARHGRRLLVDGISSFGGYEAGAGKTIDFDCGPIDHFAGSPNKCLEGAPGFCYVISRREAMVRAQGNARSLVLDLWGHWNDLETLGKLRYTPATQAMLGFRVALHELRAEGGVPARVTRYQENHRLLVEGMTRLGYRTLIDPAHQSHIITTFLYPNAQFDFGKFYGHLRANGLEIYPGKLTELDTFRIGSIGSIGAKEIATLLDAVGSFS